MTEEEWLACDDPHRKLDFLRDSSIGRPLILFAVACCRTQRSLMRDGRSRRAVELAERVAEGRVRVDDSDGPSDGDCYLMATAANRCMAVAGQAALGETALAIDFAQEILECLADNDEPTAHRHRRKAAHFAACIFGNPFRRCRIEPAWLTWDGAIILRLAEGIYEGRHFARTPVLADALEDAGCADADLLAHLRSPGPHVRGCWALDLVLGKG